MRPLLESIYERRFATNGIGRFRGVFSSFAEANRSAPRNKPLGFNCAEYGREFRDRLNRVYSFDYPMLFWLNCLLRNDITIFDFGGHAGTHFYAYSKYLAYPSGLKWIVCDLPEITRAGEDLAREQQKKGISFTNRFEDCNGADILIAAGSLQYIESPSFSEQLATLSDKPRHLLLNKLPLYNGETFVTLQNGGPSYHPQYVFNRGQFIQSIRLVGYELVDQWSVETHPGKIPFHPEKSFYCHSGLCFRLVHK